MKKLLFALPLLLLSCAGAQLPSRDQALSAAQGCAMEVLQAPESADLHKAIIAGDDKASSDAAVELLKRVDACIVRELGK